MAIEVREPQTEEELEQYYRIRFDRLRAPVGEAPGSERDHPTEPISEHLIGLVDGRVVGALCWVVLRRGTKANPEVYVRIRQIAVSADAEGAGVASAMENVVVERAREVGAVELVATMRREIAGLADSLGWKVTGAAPTAYDAEHVNIVKRLG